MWLESLLFHTLPAPIGAFMERHAMPFIGVHTLQTKTLGGCLDGGHTE